MLNKVCLMGRVGADPEVRGFASGDHVASLTLATSESWKDKATGERKEKTEWHRVSVFNKSIVNVIEKYVAKGDLIYIEGKLKTRKYTDQKGVEKYLTEVVLENFSGELRLIPTSKKAVDAAPEQQPAHTAHHEAKANGYAPAPAIDSDDIPF